MYEGVNIGNYRLLASSFSQDFVHQQEVTYEHTSKPAMLDSFCCWSYLKSDNAPNLKGYRPPNECNDYLVPIALPKTNMESENAEF